MDVVLHKFVDSIILLSSLPIVHQLSRTLLLIHVQNITGSFPFTTSRLSIMSMQLRNRVEEPIHKECTVWEANRTVRILHYRGFSVSFITLSYRTPLQQVLEDSTTFPLIYKKIRLRLSKTAEGYLQGRISPCKVILRTENGRICFVAGTLDVQ